MCLRKGCLTFTLPTFSLLSLGYTYGSNDLFMLESLLKCDEKAVSCVNLTLDLGSVEEPLHFDPERLFL